MKQTLLVANLMLLAAFLAAAQKTPESMLGAAMHQAEVQGDLKGAIAAYQKVVATRGVSRKTAADALLRMGQCYEKLGDTESRKAYERVLREYADQKEAVVVARARLGVGAEAKNAGITTRQIWTGPKVDAFGTVSPDGRSLSFVDWSTGDLAIHDLVNGNDRRLTNKGTWQENDEFAEESVISRDGKQVAYSWFNKDFRYELRLANLSGDPNARRLFDNEDVEWMGPFDWTPDGKWIAVQITRKDKTSQIGMISTEDGSLRVLKSMDWRGASKLCFSPDGKYLAYDLPQNESVEQRDIFLLAIDGSREIPAVVHPANDKMMGWMPDGKHLLFGSDRTGTIGVWALAVSDGKIQGLPELIKTNIGQVSSLGLTRSGAMYFGLRSGILNVYVASIDFTSGNVLSPPAIPVLSFIGENNFPDWSRDGKYLSYISRRELGGRIQLLAVRSMETGKTRELRLNLSNIYGRRYWSPDGRFIALGASDHKGRQGIYRIDLENGEASPLVLSEPGVFSNLIGWSADASKLHYRHFDPATKESIVTERELASGKEREVLRWTGGHMALSSDGRQLAFIKLDRPTKSTRLMVVPVEGGEPKELVKSESPESMGGFNNLEWTPDGRSIIFRKDNGKQNELWQVLIADGKSRKLPIDLPVRQLRLHPDGRQMTFLSGDATREIWVMENFLPTLSAKK